MSRKMDSQRVARTKYLAFRRMMREYLRAAYEQTDTLDLMTRRATAVFLNQEGWRDFFESVNRGLDTSRRLYGVSGAQAEKNEFLSALLGVIAQFPYVLRQNDPMSDDTLGWTRLAMPKQMGWGHVSEQSRLRLTLEELGSMVDAGVPLWMAERFDTGQDTYPVDVVTEAYLNGYPDEFVWALLGGEPS